MNPAAFRSIALEVTAHCNQRCVYCYNAWRGDGGASAGQPTTAELLALLDRLLVQQAPHHLTLTGGEPFIRTDLPQIIEYINRRGPAVVVISNGGLLDSTLVQQLRRLRILAVQLTLAGATAAQHDELCGTGSFARTLRALDLLGQNGIPRVGSILCTGANAAHIAQIADLFAGRGVNRLAFNRLNPSGYGRPTIRALMPTRTQVLQALAAIDRQAELRQLQVTNTMPIPPCMLDTAQFPHLRFGQCSAATAHGEPAIGPHGEVRLCTLQPTAIGTLAEASLSELYARPAAISFRQQIPVFCQPCPRAPTCLGGCGAAAQWAFGSPAELDPFIAQHVMPDFAERLTRLTELGD